MWLQQVASQRWVHSRPTGLTCPPAGLADLPRQESQPVPAPPQWWPTLCGEAREGEGSWQSQSTAAVAALCSALPPKPGQSTKRGGWCLVVCPRRRGRPAPLPAVSSAPPSAPEKRACLASCIASTRASMLPCTRRRVTTTGLQGHAGQAGVTTCETGGSCGAATALEGPTASPGSHHTLAAPAGP